MKYHCIVNAFARCLDMTPEELVSLLPHDGTSELPDGGQRSHHIQEMIDVSSNRGVWFCPIELVPQGYYPQYEKVYPVYFGDIGGNFERFRGHLKNSTGILVGARSGIGHAVFWDGEQCEDDRGKWNLWGVDTYFIPSTYWRSVWIT